MSQQLDGGGLGLLWALPFLGVLFSIALGPVAFPRAWHHHTGKIMAGWAMVVVVPLALVYSPGLAGREMAAVSVHDYPPFLILLTALYTVTGGIRVSGNFGGTPIANTAILAVGTLLAGWIGTTGASMLMIRGLIAANRGRTYQAHVIVFFILLVSNIGGALSPLGDPPLFLGYLRGVEFFWPTVHLLTPTAFTVALILIVFVALDTVLYGRERGAVQSRPHIFHIEVRGAANLLLLSAMIATLMVCGKVRLGELFTFAGVHVTMEALLRDSILIALTFLSYFGIARPVRAANYFSWSPMIEVAKVFAGIFITIVPVLAMLKSGENGPFAALLEQLESDGQPADHMYFIITGVLSAFLDNAPTYLVFFNAAGGDPKLLMGPLATTLVAISAGAVFMGALTYVGNAPNFMVRSVAEHMGVRMPSFFGYMAWSLAICVPIFTLVTVVFF